eukprot:COSAG05_NODE_1_length_66591_cov_307.301581_39_plen_93_part_00
MVTRLNGRDDFGTFQRGGIHVSIDIFNLNSFLFRRWETIIVFPPSRGLLLGFNIYAVYVFPHMNMHNQRLQGQDEVAERAEGTVARPRGGQQ